VGKGLVEAVRKLRELDDEREREGGGRVFTEEELYRLANYGVDPRSDETFVGAERGRYYFYRAEEDEGRGLLARDYSRGWEQSLGWSEGTRHPLGERSDLDVYLEKLLKDGDVGACHSILDSSAPEDSSERADAVAAEFFETAFEYLGRTYLQKDRAELVPWDELLPPAEVRESLAKLRGAPAKAARSWQGLLACLGVRLSRGLDLFCYRDGRAPSLAAREPLYGLPSLVLLSSARRPSLERRAEAALSLAAARRSPANPARMPHRLYPRGTESGVEVLQGAGGRRTACVPLWASLGELPPALAERVVSEDDSRDARETFRRTGSVVDTTKEQAPPEEELEPESEEETVSKYGVQRRERPEREHPEIPVGDFEYADSESE
jgi:hypothetical protein